MDWHQPKPKVVWCEWISILCKWSLQLVIDEKPKLVHNQWIFRFLSMEGSCGSCGWAWTKNQNLFGMNRFPCFVDEACNLASTGNQNWFTLNEFSFFVDRGLTWLGIHWKPKLVWCECISILRWWRLQLVIDRKPKLVHNIFGPSTAKLKDCPMHSCPQHIWHLFSNANQMTPFFKRLMQFVKLAHVLFAMP